MWPANDGWTILMVSGGDIFAMFCVIYNRDEYHKLQYHFLK